MIVRTWHSGEANVLTQQVHSFFQGRGARVAYRAPLLSLRRRLQRAPSTSLTGGPANSAHQRSHCEDAGAGIVRQRLR